MRGVRRVEPRLWGHYFDPLVNANYTLLVRADAWMSPGQVEIGPGVARARNLDRANRFPVVAHDGSVVQLLVRDVFPGNSELVASDSSSSVMTATLLLFAFALSTGWRIATSHLRM